MPRWHLHDPAAAGQPPTAVAYPHAGAANAEVTLHLLDLDGGWVDVHWDRETYPYLVAVSWSEAGGPLITVLRRLQQHGLVLAVDPRTGETQVHAELADPRWVEPVAGTPRAPAGRPGAGRRRAGPRRLRRPLPVRRRQPAHPAAAVRAAGRGRLAAPVGRPTCSSRPATASRASSTCSGSARRLGVGGARRAGSPPSRAGTSRRGRRRHAGRSASLSLEHAGCAVDRSARGDAWSATSRRWPRRRRTRRARSWSGSPTGGCRPACSTRAATSPGGGCRCWSTSTAAPATRRWSPRGPAGRRGSGGPTPGFAVVVDRQPGHARGGAELREGDPPAASPT